MNPTTWFTRPPTVRHPGPPDPPVPVSIAARQAVLDALAAELERYAQISRRLGTAAARAQAREDEIAALHREATQHRVDASAAALAESLTHERQVHRLEAQLRRGAPECIDRFLSELEAVEQEMRLAVETRISDGHADPMSGHRVPIVSTNAPGIDARLAALQAARVSAEALRLTALSEAEILAQLTALRDGIPDMEPLARDQSWVFSPGEIRQAEWRAEDSLARRWSHAPKDW